MLTTFQFFSTVLALVGVYLAGRQSYYKWILSIFSNSIAFSVYFNSALYIKSILSVIFIINSFFGLYKWKFSRKNSISKCVSGGSGNNVSTLRLYQRVMILVISVTAILAIRVIYRRYELSFSILESFTIMSVIAHILMAYKKIETWVIWIFLDATSTMMCIKKGLYIFALKYMIYILLAIYGFIKWRRDMGDSRCREI